ncbi:MAG: hypothetical protein V3V05_06680 [Pontiella sp.]
MESLKNLDSMTWIILAAAGIICSVVLFNKAIKFMLKLAVLIVMILFVGYFLLQAGVIELPLMGN